MFDDDYEATNITVENKIKISEPIFNLRLDKMGIGEG